MTRNQAAARYGLPIATIAVLLGCGALPGSTDDAQPIGATIQVVRSDLEIAVPAEGYLEALSASAVAVPNVPTGSLKVKQVVAEGSIVEKGQVVLVFDDSQLNIELSNHKASFRSADRRIDRTQLQSSIEAETIAVMKQVAELERDNADIFEIVDESIYSKLDILEQSVRKEEAEETVLYADAALLLRGEYYNIEERILGVEKGQVEGKMSRVETSLANLVLKAPIGGMVVYKKNWRGNTVNVGDTLRPGNVVMSCVDPTSTALKSYVLERDATGITEGTAATIRVDADPARVFNATVKTVAEMSSPIERGSPVKYFEVLLELTDGDPQLLKPGLKGTARIVTGQLENAVVMPRSALRGEPDAHFVLLADGRNVPVQIGPGDAVRVSITAGLEGGERLLIGTPPADAVPAIADLATPPGS